MLDRMAGRAVVALVVVAEAALLELHLLQDKLEQAVLVLVGKVVEVVAVLTAVAAVPVVLVAHLVAVVVVVELQVLEHHQALAVLAVRVIVVFTVGKEIIWATQK